MYVGRRMLPLRPIGLWPNLLRNSRGVLRQRLLSGWHHLHRRGNLLSGRGNVRRNMLPGWHLPERRLLR
jgi:hypothetical protein